MVKKTRKLLNTDQQINKFRELDQIAKGNLDPELLNKLGSFVIYHGMVEFYTIQSARLLEQIILKAQLHENKQPKFKPHEDIWFYDEQISTRRILKEIKKFLPFKDISSGKVYDKEISGFLKSVNAFLDYRNSLIHRLASPSTNLEDIGHCCDKAIKLYKVVIQTHKIMFEALAPYRFSLKEIDYYYCNNSETKTKV